MASGPSTAPVDETSPIATFASELRATAPAFVPSQTALPTALPTEWASAGPSTNDPNSSAPTLSPYHMIQSPLDLPPYAVAFGWNMPGGYNFSTLPPPPGISATLPARHAGAPLASPTALSSSNAGPQGVSSAYETSHEASPPVSPTGAAPFQAQLDLIASASTATVQPATKQTTTTQQPTAPTSPPRRSYGRGATIINTDYTVNHPTPTEYQSSIPFFMQRIPFPPPPARTHPRTSIPFIHPPSHRPYRQNGPAGNALSGNSVYDINARIRGPAFMPLEFTRPFPSPVVPAAMRGEGEEGGSGEYVGYAVEDGEVVRRETCCGEMRVEAAMEYGGGWCHGCVP
ncbi:hypothetical protein EJ04DRAFT_299446 [Polyplosphaeria fusca]|uniref:Uncharacterized protein n=1 Tax=Polyplosphaeria fusca TaxID=682080 RepID=A0A9P4QSD3_9PLEO|nr:hypothetical protein EJ04DRAFT_299446 [Polyplosphaeria fusca]